MFLEFELVDPSITKYTTVIPFFLVPNPDNKDGSKGDIRLVWDGLSVNNTIEFDPYMIQEQKISWITLDFLNLCPIKTERMAKSWKFATRKRRTGDHVAAVPEAVGAVTACPGLDEPPHVAERALTRCVHQRLLVRRRRRAPLRRARHRRRDGRRLRRLAVQRGLVQRGLAARVARCRVGAVLHEQRDRVVAALLGGEVQRRPAAAQAKAKAGRVAPLAAAVASTTGFLFWDFSPGCGERTTRRALALCAWPWCGGGDHSRGRGAGRHGGLTRWR